MRSTPENDLLSKIAGNIIKVDKEMQKNALCGILYKKLYPIVCRQYNNHLSSKGFNKNIVDREIDCIEVTEEIVLRIKKGKEIFMWYQIINHYIIRNLYGYDKKKHERYKKVSLDLISFPEKKEYYREFINELQDKNELEPLKKFIIAIKYSDKRKIQNHRFIKELQKNYCDDFIINNISELVKIKNELLPSGGLNEKCYSR